MITSKWVHRAVSRPRVAIAAFGVAKAKGKRVFVIPTASQLPVCDPISKKATGA